MSDVWSALLVPPAGCRVQWTDSRGRLRRGTVYSGYVTLSVIADGPDGNPGALSTVDIHDIRPEETIRLEEKP